MQLSRKQRKKRTPNKAPWNSTNTKINQTFQLTAILFLNFLHLHAKQPTKNKEIRAKNVQLVDIRKVQFKLRVLIKLNHYLRLNQIPQTYTIRKRSANQ